MGDPDVATGHLIGMETPPVPLEFLNRASDILVMPNLHAHILFQRDAPQSHSSEQRVRYKGSARRTRET